MKKVLASIIIMFILLLVVTSLAENSTESILGEIDHEFVHIEIRNAELKYKEGVPCAVITYAWSHSYSSEKNFVFTVSAKVYQSGIELDRIANVTGVSDIDPLKSVMPDSTHVLSIAYKLESSDAPIEISIAQWGENPLVVSFSFPESNIEKSETISTSTRTNVDLAAMTYDELLELKFQINVQLSLSKDFKSAVVPAGIYIVGEDIPSGTYSIYGNNIATFGLYNSEEEHQKSNWEMLHIVDKDKGSSVGKAVLLDGQVVTVSGTARFETYRGLDFK